MKISIITSVSGKSSRELADHLKENGIEASVSRPFDDGRHDFTKSDYVFSYGCSADTHHKRRINSAKAVDTCVSKVKTFKALAEFPIPRWWTRKGDIPDDVEHLVIRKEIGGRSAKNLAYWEKADGPIPDGKLYTEFFFHEREYRVTVFMGQVFVYYKFRTKEDDHEFRIQPTSRFKTMVDTCRKAAIKLGIDYGSFDVVAKTKEDFVILECNSGTVLTDEVSLAIVEYFLNFKE